MPCQTTSPRLTQKFDDALAYAAEKHRHQTRKGGGIPYLGHLLSVAGYVIEADGTETEAIAALLHDTAEDQGGEATLAEIREKFGAEVAKVVAECSDTVVTPKPPFVTPNGQQFEVQIHTQASLDAAEECHPLYEEWRLTSTSPERKAELTALQERIFAAVPVPDDVELVA